MAFCTLLPEIMPSYGGKVGNKNRSYYADDLTYCRLLRSLLHGDIKITDLQPTVLGFMSRS